MNWLAIAFWLLLYAGIPSVITMHLHRKETKTNRFAIPTTILVLGGIAGTATMLGISDDYGPLEAGEALLHLSVPGITYLIGACLAIFGGPTPVGPIPKNWRRGGVMLMLISISLIIIQTLEPENLPIGPPIMHEIAISSLLVGTSLVGAIGTVVVLSIGEKRWSAAIATLSLSIGSISLLWMLTTSDISTIDAAIFSNAIGDSLKSAIGTSIGIGFGLWVSFHVAIIIERGEKLPETASQVTGDEMELVKKHLKTNIGGEEE